MMLRALLPRNRWNTGRLWVETSAGAILAGPWPCRGKADGQIALLHGNPSRDPTKPYGDHPTGTYKVSALVHNKQPVRSYGPCFILLDPVAGDALTAEEAERVGLAIHGGDPTPEGTLRASEGCLRVSNATSTLLAGIVKVGMEYICEEGEIA